MYLYLIIFILIVFSYFRIQKGESNSPKYLAYWMTLLSVFVGTSDMLGGYDRYIYGELFDQVADVTISKGNYLSCYIFELYSKEVGYDGLNILISFFTKNRYVFIFLVTVGIYTLFYISFKRYTQNNGLALILFMGLMFFFTFTYLRQMLSVGIVWLSLKYVYEHKLWKFLGVIFIAVLFHNSAIILLPVYFILVKKFSVQSISVVMVLCLFLGISGIPAKLFDIYGVASGLEERANLYSTDTSGFRMAYLVEVVFFLWLILGNYKKIPAKLYDMIFLNVALIFCAILLIFIRSENGGRLGWYYMIGIISTLTRLVVNGKHSNKYLLVFISLFLYIRILVGWGLLLSPYKTFFTNGVRENDPVYEKYEYDRNYTLDKFYR